ncbi:hypothetical protein ACWD8I_03045 [Micromonospora arida]|uniref:hypothetical protein n=1 Tax=Micromonospora arida TaxID=2203715 RepID=UPI00339FC705
MAGRLPGQLLLRRENLGKASFLELSFDLAFIFALTRLWVIVLFDAMPRLWRFIRQARESHPADQRLAG